MITRNAVRQAITSGQTRGLKSLLHGRATQGPSKPPHQEPQSVELRLVVEDEAQRPSYFTAINSTSKTSV